MSFVLRLFSIAGLLFIFTSLLLTNHHLQIRRYIVLLLITGTVWAQTGLDKLVLKDGTISVSYTHLTLPTKRIV